MRFCLRRVWRGSCLDEATKDKYPCRKVVAHPYVQHVLENFFCGEYVGSEARIAHSDGLGSVCIQIILQVFDILCCFCLKQWKIQACHIEKPVQMANADVSRSHQASGIGRTLPCTSRLSGSGRAPSWQTSGSPAQRSGGAVRNSVGYDTESDESEYDESVFGNDGSTVAHTALSDTLYERWRLWCGFFSIPKVKFVVHSMSYCVTMASLGVLLLRPLHSAIQHPGWCRPEIIHDRPANVCIDYWIIDLELIMRDTVWRGTQFSALAFEAYLLFSWLGRVVEEYVQLKLKGMREYVRSNIVDLVVICTVLCCVGLRTYVWHEAYGATGSNFDETRSRLPHDFFRYYDALRQLYAFAFFVMSLKFTVDIMSYQPLIGETVHIIISMLVSGTPVLLLAFFLSLALGVTWVGLNARVIDTLNPNPSFWPSLARSLYEPLFHPLVSLLGENEPPQPEGIAYSSADSLRGLMPPPPWWTEPLSFLWSIVTSVVRLYMSAHTIHECLIFTLACMPLQIYGPLHARELTVTIDACPPFLSTVFHQPPDCKSHNGPLAMLHWHWPAYSSLLALFNIYVL